MAFEIPGRKMTRVAGADLSSKQHHFVKLDTDGTVIAMAAETDIPYGILQDNPSAAGKEAGIMKDGVSKLIAGEAIAIGDLVGTNSAGRAQVMVHGTDTTKYIVGVALSAAAADGEEFSVDFSCAAPHRGA